MDEKQWLSNKKPWELLAFLEGKWSDRKWRLYACASARILWDTITPFPFREVVEAAEAFADGLCTEVDISGIRAVAELAIGPPSSNVYEHYTANHCAYLTAYPESGAEAAWHAGGVMGQVWQTMMKASGGYSDAAHESQCILECEIIHDLAGNPFRAKPSEVVCSQWRTRTVRELAEAIHYERCFEAFPVLGDALEEVGCNDSAILAHCREPRIRVRGCWLLDLLLNLG